MRRVVSLGLTVGVAASCDSIVEVTDPDIILDANSAAGAIALRNGALLRLAQATSGGEFFVFSGLLTDEWISGDTFEQRNSTDQRNIAVTNSFLDDDFRALNRVRNLSDDAIAALRTFSPNPSGNIGMMFAIKAFVENQIGETYCNGIPFSDYDGANVVFGAPLPYDSAFARAIASADSAQLYVAGSDGARVTNLAKVVKGRALLNRGQFAAAAQAVAGVPTTFKWDVTHSENAGINQIWSLNNSASRYVVAELEGGVGLNFVTAADPRLPTSKPKPKAFDSSTDFVQQDTYARLSSVSIASGIEALLITAEAALRANDVTTWLAKLNEARATNASLAPLADPGDAAARVNLTFRERAFWMFSTGHRLGDLRRLIRQYGRAQNTVFPTGTHFKGPTYGTDVNFPISFDELNNPNAPGNQQQSTCTDRVA
ncbi:MAG: hypothetical protein FJ206_12580 [Gemmatimonadetes bacterium]|nr:hypothetical protein [Gemmatimonadota bacterium]